MQKVFCLRFSLHHQVLHCLSLVSNAPLVTLILPFRTLRVLESGIDLFNLWKHSVRSRVLASSVAFSLLLFCSRVLAMFLAKFVLAIEAASCSRSSPDPPRVLCPSRQRGFLFTAELQSARQSRILRYRPEGVIMRASSTISIRLRLDDDDDYATSNNGGHV